MVVADPADRLPKSLGTGRSSPRSFQATTERSWSSIRCRSRERWGRTVVRETASRLSRSRDGPRRTSALRRKGRVPGRALGEHPQDVSRRRRNHSTLARGGRGQRGRPRTSKGSLGTDDRRALRPGHGTLGIAPGRQLVVRGSNRRAWRWPVSGAGGRQERTTNQLVGD